MSLIEFLAQLDPAWIALIGTLFGGVGLKVAEQYLGKAKYKIDDARDIRDELRLELDIRRKENDVLEDDVDKWRDSYYDLRDKNVLLETTITLLRDRLSRYEEVDF